jgi:hypothetical protein
MMKPMPPFSHLVDEVEAYMCAKQSDTLFRFARHAQRNPSSSAGIQVRIISCSGLVLQDPAKARPYVHYQFPGYLQPVDTAVQHGSSPCFHEKRIFEFAPDPQTSRLFLAKLRDAALHLQVFDAAETGLEALIGAVSISLQ